VIFIPQLLQRGERAGCAQGTVGPTLVATNAGRFRRRGRYLGGDGIGHCEKKVHTDMCLKSE
jgi:hypothetical protein